MGEIVSASVKLSNTVKALCFLVRKSPDPQSSSEIGRNTCINSSKIRQLLSMVCKAGIISSVQGPSGGFVLNRKPEDIHLQEIYCAIEDRKAFHLDIADVRGGECSSTLKVNDFFQNLFDEIQVEIEEKMKNISLADIAGTATKK
jgi:Rrf2 family protein